MQVESGWFKCFRTEVEHSKVRRQLGHSDILLEVNSVGRERVSHMTVVHDVPEIPHLDLRPPTAPAAFTLKPASFSFYKVSRNEFES
jgi:hypothetical protein